MEANILIVVQIEYKEYNSDKKEFIFFNFSLHLESKEAQMMTLGVLIANGLFAYLASKKNA